MRSIGFSLFFATACLAATPALAGNAKLVWNDLDLGTEAGRAELDSRIEAAAQQVCAPEAVTGSRLAPSNPSARCLLDARDEIRAQLAARTKADPSRFAASGGSGAEAR
jgi:UrcA family protein